MRIPRCTYRVQLNAGFTFDDLTARLPYLHGLGVSDCYCSPVFRATPGSRHGYDVCDYDLVNPELGGEAGLRRLAAGLRAHEMGLLLDFVPNHMGIAGPFNRWWRDVLENGPASAYATFFDIDWNDGAGPGRVFAPLLPDHYGVLLEQGKLRLVHEDGELTLLHEQTRLPLRPESYAAIFRAIAPAGAGELRARADFKTRVAREPEARAALEDYLARLNGTPGEPGSFDALDRLIESQHYRLTRWQAGTHGTNYRRFFAIDTLVGLRMEDARVFAESHTRLGGLIREGVVTGLRIDHIDGLRDPEAYLERLQGLAVGALSGDGASVPDGIYVLVEKILAAGESLPASWATAGTSGYEFTGQLAGLFTERRSEAEFDAIHGEFTGRRECFDAVVRDKKRLILAEMFANTVFSLAQSLAAHVHIDRRWRDLTPTELSAAIGELIAGFRVYRTYRREATVTPEDRAEIEHAASAAIANNPRIEPRIVRFVRDVLLGDYPEPAAIAAHREAMRDWAMTFQQYTGAVTAKAVEDTAYYTYNRLVALNEVGGAPEAFGGDVAEFHRLNQARARRGPHTLLATSTHDTKMSEDVRARLYALSEIPDEWRAWLAEWSVVNAGHKTRVGGQFAPDADEEYRLYQMLLGAWPLAVGATEAGAGLNDVFRERIAGYLRKAVSEAKVNTSIVHANEPWLAACDRFVAAALAEDGDFVARFRPAAARLARLGAINSLSQVVLKLTAPGVPDLYQGNEGWDFSLVDPDNRREVDYAALQSLAARGQDGAPGAWAALLARWETGEIKLAVTRRLLRFRRERPELFRAGDYTPLELTGGYAGNAVAYLRESKADRLLVIVPRLTARLAWPPVGAVWADTRVRLDAETSSSLGAAAEAGREGRGRAGTAETAGKGTAGTEMGTKTRTGGGTGGWTDLFTGACWQGGAGGAGSPGGAGGAGDAAGCGDTALHGLGGLGLCEVLGELPFAVLHAERGGGGRGC